MDMSIATLLQAISGYKNPSHGSRWYGRDV